MLRLLHYSNIEDAFDDAERIGCLAGCVSTLDSDDTLVVGTGDNTAPGVLSLVGRNGQTLDFYNAVDADLKTFGNHDFDYGSSRIRELVVTSRPTQVMSDVHGENGGRFAVAGGTVPRTTREMDGLTLGFFGVTDPTTSTINPEAADVGFSDPYAATADTAAVLRDDGTDLVVTSSYLGNDNDELVVQYDVGLILGSHVHVEHDDVVDSVPIVRPSASGYVVWEVRVAANRIEAVHHWAAEYQVDEGLVAALAGRVDATDLNEVFCRIDRPMDHTEETVAVGERRIGDVIADAYRQVTGTDVGLWSSGSIRPGSPIGPEVTHADLVGLVPFEEHLVVTEVTDTELLTVFGAAHGAEMGFDGPDWWHAHISDAHTVWGDDRDEVVTAFIGGESIGLEASYTITTSDYLLHSIQEFPAITQAHRGGEFEIQHDALARHTHGIGFDAAVEGRIKRRSANRVDD